MNPSRKFTGRIFQENQHTASVVYQVYDDPVELDGIMYEGTVKIIRMWTHYDGVR